MKIHKTNFSWKNNVSVNKLVKLEKFMHLSFGEKHSKRIYERIYNEIFKKLEFQLSIFTLNRAVLWNSQEKVLFGLFVNKYIDGGSRLVGDYMIVQHFEQVIRIRVRRIIRSSTGAFLIFQPRRTVWRLCRWISVTKYPRSTVRSFSRDASTFNFQPRRTVLRREIVVEYQS